MTQLSPNTIVQDQIVAKVSKFLANYRENQFFDNQELMKEYQSLINFLRNKISRTTY
jgi:hypothetical protein